MGRGFQSPEKGTISFLPFSWPRDGAHSYPSHPEDCSAAMSQSHRQVLWMPYTLFPDLTSRGPGRDQFPLGFCCPERVRLQCTEERGCAGWWHWQGGTAVLEEPSLLFQVVALMEDPGSRRWSKIIPMEEAEVAVS